VFSIEKNYDENYVFLPLDFVQDLLDYGNRRTAIEIKTKLGSDVRDVQQELKAKLGDAYSVLTNEEQHSDLYKLLKFEKIFTFLALAILIIVGSINIFFSLMMLAIDKKKDITILSALGAGRHLISRIFLTEGALIASVGACIGLIFGALICWLQQNYGLVSMGMENAIVANYPVKMQLTDFFITASFLVLVTLAVSFYPAALASKSYTTENL
jgi:lipoprotein-releasing system permease protein